MWMTWWFDHFSRKFLHNWHMRWQIFTFDARQEVRDGQRNVNDNFECDPMKYKSYGFKFRQDFHWHFPMANMGITDVKSSVVWYIYILWLGVEIVSSHCLFMMIWYNNAGHFRKCILHSVETSGKGWWRHIAWMNNSTLLQIMAWRQSGAKPLSEPVLTYCQQHH